MEQLIGAIKGYDPNYKAKVKQAVGIIDNEFSKRKQFSAADINRHLDIDCNRYLKLLGRLGFLRKEAGAEKVANYSRTSLWPPPAEFFKGTPIGGRIAAGKLLVPDLRFEPLHVRPDGHC
jgi:hypothetical protein